MSDQSALICMGGLIITMVCGLVTAGLRLLFNIESDTRHALELLYTTLTPAFWIYMSDKLRAVLKKWMRIWG